MLPSFRFPDVENRRSAQNPLRRVNVCYRDLTPTRTQLQHGKRDSERNFSYAPCYFCQFAAELACPNLTTTAMVRRTAAGVRDRSPAELSMRKPFSRWLSLWICATLASACGSHSLLSFTIFPQDVTLKVGTSVQFTATGVFNSPPSPESPLPDVTWISSNPRLLAIDSSGLATCKDGSEGATLTVTATVPTSPGPPMSLITTVTCE